MEEILKVEHLVKDFGTNKVLKDIDFSVYKGDVISIIGSSGSGKSTLLRCINMLEDATGGSIFYHGKDILKGGVNEDAFRTKVGMVFQSFNLFPQYNVLQNVTLAVKLLVLVLSALGLANLWEAVFADVGVSVIAILNAMRAMRTAKMQ